MKRNDRLQSKGMTQLLIAATVGCLSSVVPVLAKADECTMLNGVSFQYVFSNVKLRNVLSNVIKDNIISAVSSLDKLSVCYETLGKKYQFEKTEYNVDGQYYISYRFDLDQTGWIWPAILAVPGGSNGKYFAVFRYYVQEGATYLFIPRGHGQLIELTRERN